MAHATNLLYYRVDLPWGCGHQTDWESYKGTTSIRMMESLGFTLISFQLRNKSSQPDSGPYAVQVWYFFSFVRELLQVLAAEPNVVKVSITSRISVPARMNKNKNRVYLITQSFTLSTCKYRAPSRQVIGDIHGQIDDILAIFKLNGIYLNYWKRAVRPLINDQT